MSKTKHTSGVWTVLDVGGSPGGILDKYGDDVSCGDCWLIEDENGRLIAMTGDWFDSTHDETRANACVIAAVPDLLAACEYLASKQGKIPAFVGSEFIEIARDMARAAIGKTKP